MHGRVKVKTTEQQEREKKVERDAKLKAYRSVRQLFDYSSQKEQVAIFGPCEFLHLFQEAVYFRVRCPLLYMEMAF